MNTESVNIKTKGISDATTEEMLYMINDEDATVAGVVRKVIPQVAKLGFCPTGAYLKVRERGQGSDSADKTAC